MIGRIVAKRRLSPLPHNASLEPIDLIRYPSHYFKFINIFLFQIDVRLKFLATIYFHQTIGDILLTFYATCFFTFIYSIMLYTLFYALNSTFYKIERIRSAVSFDANAKS